LCWNKSDVRRGKCFVSLVNNNYSNVWTHIKGKHQEAEYSEIIPGGKTGGKASTNTNLSSLTGDSANSSKIGGGTQSLLTSCFKPTSPNQALTYLYRFFNEANVAIRQSSNENLKLFIEYLIDNGSSFKQRKIDCQFSKYKYKKFEVDDFSFFVQMMKYLVNITREYYKDNLKTNTPFITVAHDGWDSKDHDILGVSVHFVCPVLWIPVNLAVGLQRIFNKTAASLHQVIMEILRR
jgi:hypothetical protein